MKAGMKRDEGEEEEERGRREGREKTRQGARELDDRNE